MGDHMLLWDVAGNHVAVGKLPSLRGEMA